MPFSNCYADAARAQAYAKLEFANTYYLAYRDLPEIIARHVQGAKALDFGCGTGRSTRYLRRLGFQVTGVDISEDMLRLARLTDADGDYRLVGDGDLSAITPGFDLVLSAFTFDNIPAEKKLLLFTQLRRLLTAEGVLVNLVSSPEIYLHEWASFSTREFPENRQAKSGDVVRIITTDLEDRRPAADVLCTDEAYQEVYSRAGLRVIETRQPLAAGDEPYPWVSETTVAPWTIYVLALASR